MDAVILAAGKSERLTGVVAPYMKPLLVINGKPLIVDIAEKASRQCARIVIVVAPENALQITQIVPDDLDAHYVVQPRPKGPGDALKRALWSVSDRDTLLLLADNIVPELSAFHVEYGDFHKDDTVISVQPMVASEATRYTYFDGDRWREKEPYVVPTATVHAWCGPVRFRTKDMLRVLTHSPVVQNGEELIGPQFNNFMQGQRRPVVDSYDIGTPEMVMEVTRANRLHEDRA